MTMCAAYRWSWCAIVAEPPSAYLQTFRQETVPPTLCSYQYSCCMHLTWLLNKGVLTPLTSCPTSQGQSWNHAIWCDNHNEHERGWQTCYIAIYGWRTTYMYYIVWAWEKTLMEVLTKSDQSDWQTPFGGIVPSMLECWSWAYVKMQLHGEASAKLPTRWSWLA